MNNYPISVAQLAEGINNAGSMLASAGNSYEKTIAMLAAANTTVQDISKSSTGLRTIAARIRNTKTELDDLGEAMTDANYDALVRGLTKANVALTDAQGNFRSTYDIIRDLSKVWNQLSNIDQAALAKTLAGTRQQNVFFSLIEQFQEAENAMDSMEKSMGALSSAMSIYESTATAHINSLKAAFLDLAQSIIDNGFINELTDIGEWFIELIKKIADLVNALGGLKTVLIGVGVAFATIKIIKIIGWVKELYTGVAAFIKLIPHLSMLKANSISVATGIEQISGSAKAATAAMSAMKTMIVAAIAVSTMLIANHIKKIKEAKEEAKRLKQEAIENSRESLANNTSRINSLYELRQEYQNIIDSESDETTKTQELDNWKQKLIETYGFEKEAIANVNKERETGLKLIDDERKRTVQSALADATAAYNDAVNTLSRTYIWDGRVSASESSQSAVADVIARYFPNVSKHNDKGTGYFYEDWARSLGIQDTQYWVSGRSGDGVYGDINSLKEYLDIIEGAINDLQAKKLRGETLTSAESTVLTSLSQNVSGIRKTYEEAAQAYDNYNRLLAENYILQMDINSGTIKTVDDYNNLRNTIQNLYGDNQPVMEQMLDIVQILFPRFSEEAGSIASDADNISVSFQTISDSASKVTKDFDSAIKGISSLQTVLAKQSTGASLSLDDFNSEELKDYTSALEYHNGVLQLNAEKTRKIVEANTKAELSQISYNKAVAQSKYLQNAKEIQRLTEKIRTNTYETGENQDVIEDKIELLQGENNTLLTTCAQYDLMSASLREATDSYHNWLNAQKASQAGDMFDDTLDAINRINDTLNNKDSDYFGRVGRTDYQAALDFVIPDTVDREDADAINSYLESVSDLFTYDDNDNRAGLNITNFCKQAVEQGLMVFDEASDSYLVAGQTTMEDFAKGMNLSLPLVQAMFGEMEEFGGKFSWADEAVKTLGDLAISANVAADKLRGLHGDFDVTLDYSDLETTAEKLEAIDFSISDMQNAKAHIIEMGLDPNELDDVNAIIQYLVAQKQQLTAPAVMNIDISKVSENTGAALQLLVDFQNACNELELKQELGLDTTEAQGKVDALYAEITESDNDALLTLGIDTTSVETVKASLEELSQEDVLTKLNLDDTVLKGYRPEDKEGTVHYDVDTSKVDAYNPKNLQRTVTYYVRTSGMDKLNGTAHAGGTAFASGDWGTAPGGETLTGELGREIVVDPHTGRWYTVGDNGAEFVNIPRGSIVFNHKQTEQLLKNGFVSGRASALVGGTAMVTGGIGAGNADNSSHSGGNKPYSGGSSSSSSNNSSSKSDKEPQIIDWIEIVIARIERGIKKLKTVAESTYKSLKTKLGASYDEIAKVNKEIAVQQQGYNRYLKQAESVGLSSGLKEKVRNGTIDINQYNEDTQKLIKDYQQWYILCRSINYGGVFLFNCWESLKLHIPQHNDEISVSVTVTKVERNM